MDSAIKSGVYGALGAGAGASFTRGGKLLSDYTKCSQLNNISMNQANFVSGETISGHGNATKIESVANATGNIVGDLISNQ